MSRFHEVRKFCRQLQRDGWRMEFTGRSHVKLIHPNGRYFTMSSTPSCPHWRKKAIGDARRIARGPL